MNAYRLAERLGFRRLVGALYRVEVVGAEHIPQSGGCIVAANHDSLADPVVLAFATEREIRYMAKAELFANRVLAAVTRAFGAFPVERGAGDRAAFSEAADLLRRGEVLGIFPQGTSKQLPVRPWHRGAARLALATGAPIVPVRLIGTRALPLRARVQIRVGPPIAVEPGRPSVAAAKALTARVEREVSAA